MRGRARTALLAAVTVVTAAVATGVVTGVAWVRRHPSALPYAARWVVDLPHPLITRSRLREALRPRTGERILEIGPGTGYYSVPLALWVTASGRLDVLDLQQEFLDHTLRATTAVGADHVVATQGDARALPYPDATFDAVCLLATLGEIPDPTDALREAARVLRPGGRAIVGEYVLDVDWIRPRTLTRHAAAAGLDIVRRVGSPLGYFAVLASTTERHPSDGSHISINDTRPAHR